MFVFPFVLEKRPIRRVEGCVTQILEIRKKVRTDISITDTLIRLTNTKDYKHLARN